MIEQLPVFNILVTVILVLLLYYWYKRPTNFPKGPRGVPILGVLPFLGTNAPKALMEWGPNYGSVFSVRMAREDLVVLNDFEAVSEALLQNGSMFSGRPSIPFLETYSKAHGVLFITNNKRWTVQRKFGMSTLRGFGAGKRKMEDKIREEIEYLIHNIDSSNEEPVDVLRPIAQAVANNICSITMGSRYEYDDPIYKELIKIIETTFVDPTNSFVTQIVLLAPIVTWIPYFNNAQEFLFRNFEAAIRIFKRMISSHKETFHAEDLRDFVDAFLKEMKDGTDTFTDTQLERFMLDLFIAGTETSTTTLRWAVLCLIHYPQSQKKLFQEIDEVLGMSGLVTMAHKPKMPYTCAFIHEVFRFRAIVPLSLTHMTTEEVNFRGYTIPKNTKIVPNLHAVHHDPKLWEKPSLFNPDRHIDVNGNFVKSKFIIPFSIGPRRCLGEHIANMEIFMFLVAMVQKFEFMPVPTEPNLPEINEGCLGIVFSPNKFKVIAKARQ